MHDHGLDAGPAVARFASDWIMPVTVAARLFKCRSEAWGAANQRDSDSELRGTDSASHGQVVFGIWMLHPLAEWPGATVTPSG